MQKRFFLVALVLAASAPAFAGKKTTLDELRAANYDSILATKDQTPRFPFHAPKGLNASHFLGGAFAVSNHVNAAQLGTEILTNYKISDPAADISNELAKLLGESLQKSTDYKDSGLASSISSSHMTLRSAKDLAREYGPGKLVVNVGTTMWTMQGARGSKFRVLYWAKAQLVDSGKPTVLASSECMFPLKKADMARDAATMLDNEAASVKAEFQEIADFCTNKFKSDLLGL